MRLVHRHILHRLAAQHTACHFRAAFTTRIVFKTDPGHNSANHVVHIPRKTNLLLPPFDDGLDEGSDGEEMTEIRIVRLWYSIGVLKSKNNRISLPHYGLLLVQSPLPSRSIGVRFARNMAAVRPDVRRPLPPAHPPAAIDFCRELANRRAGGRAGCHRSRLIDRISRISRRMDMEHVVCRTVNWVNVQFVRLTQGVARSLCFPRTTPTSIRQYPSVFSSF